MTDRQASYVDILRPKFRLVFLSKKKKEKEKIIIYLFIHFGKFFSNSKLFLSLYDFKTKNTQISHFYTPAHIFLFILKKYKIK